MGSRNQLNKNFRLLSLMIFFISVGEGITGPAIPLLAKGWGAGYWEIGLLMTGYGLAYTFMTLTAGHISDRLGRKVMLMLSLCLSIAASLGYIFAGSMLFLLVSRSIEGASRGILWPVSEAAIADNVEPGNSGKAIGFFSAAYGLGVTIGTFGGGALMSFQGYTIFAYYPVLITIAFLFISFPFSDRHQRGKPDFIHPSQRLERSRTIKLLWPVGVIGFAYGGFLYSIWALLSAMANELGVQSAGIGILLGLFWGLRTAFFLINRVLVNSHGSKVTLTAGLLMVTAGAGTLLIARSFSLLLLAVFFSGIGTGILFPTVLLLVIERTSEEKRGFGMGFLELLIGLGMVGQTALAGLLGEWAGTGWIYSSILAANGLALFVGVITRWDKSQTRIQESHNGINTT